LTVFGLGHLRFLVKAFERRFQIFGPNPQSPYG